MFDLLFLLGDDVVHFADEVQETGDKNACQKKKERRPKNDKSTPNAITAIAYQNKASDSHNIFDMDI